MNQFLSEDKVNSKMSFWQMLRQLWPLVRRHPWVLSSSVLSIIGVAVSSRLMPTLIGMAVDKGFQAHSWEMVRWCALAFLAMEVLHVVFLFLSAFLFNWFGNRMLYDLRENLIEHTQNLPMEYFNRTPLGRIVTRLTNDTATLGEVFTDGLINLFTAGVVMLSIVISMALISWKLTLATMALAPLFIWIAFRITERIRIVLRESKQRLSTLNSYVAENLNGIKVIQIFFRTERNQARFQELSGSYRDVALDSIRSYATLQPVMNLFNGVTITVALFYGGYLTHEGQLALGAFVAFLLHAQDFIHPLRETLEKFQQFQNSLTSAERVFQLQDEVPEFNPPVSAWQPKGQIDIHSLNFRYSPNLPLVLENIDLKIQAGQSVAVVGRTGSGKTTLISLLQRFYNPPPKSILLDGTPIESIEKHHLRRAVGVVQQDNFIFRGTVRENVSLGDPEISEAQIAKALEQVGAEQWLKRSGRDLNSWVEEKGANLSVGERQLIAFARILAFAPPILILDEATANVDSESERWIQEATKQIVKGRTSIIIAHRLSTIRECDKIVVLQNGRVMEEGSHSELMARQGVYSHLAEAGVNVTLIDA